MITDQFLRRCELTVAPQDGGDSLTFSDFKMKFNITRADIQTPGAFYGRVYNPSPDTVRKVQQE